MVAMLLWPNVNRSPRQTAAKREAPAAVWRRSGGLVSREFFKYYIYLGSEPTQATKAP